MKKIAALAAVTTVGLASVLVGPASHAHAAPYWNKRVKCEATDNQGRKIPTRIGNGDLGWNHFSGKHNIRKCAVVKAVLHSTPKNEGRGRLVYEVGLGRVGGPGVQVKVIAQYSRKTADEKYDAGSGKKIGVITAFCRNVPRNKCPNWINE